jgi:hypothetical protein
MWIRAVSLSPFLSLSFYLYLSLSLFLSLSLPISLSIPLSLSLFLSLFLAFYISLSLFLFRCYSVFVVIDFPRYCVIGGRIGGRSGLKEGKRPSRLRRCCPCPQGEQIETWIHWPFSCIDKMYDNRSRCVSCSEDEM